MKKLTDELIITCRTTCGCGNKLVNYEGQAETTHYLLTCQPYSEKYFHPLLIAVDKNSPIFEKARLCDELCKILMNHCGEDGDNEGAVETLTRIVDKARTLSKLDTYCTGRETVDVITLLSLGLRGRGDE